MTPKVAFAFVLAAFVRNGLRLPAPPAECMFDSETGIVALRFVGVGEFG